jgi:hypothetical protein
MGIRMITTTTVMIIGLLVVILFTVKRGHYRIAMPIGLLMITQIVRMVVGEEKQAVRDAAQYAALAAMAWVAVEVMLAARPRHAKR